MTLNSKIDMEIYVELNHFVRAAIVATMTGGEKCGQCDRNVRINLRKDPEVNVSIGPENVFCISKKMCPLPPLRNTDLPFPRKLIKNNKLRTQVLNFLGRIVT